MLNMNQANSLIQERLKTNSRVLVYSSYPLSNEDMVEIKRQIPVLANAQIDNQIDKKLLAGVIIKIGSLVIDQSLATKIQKYLKHIYE